MSRDTPIYFEGSITGTDNVVDLELALESELKAFQSAGVNAWEEYDVLTATPGTRDVIFRGKGDRDLISGAGDARFFFRIKQVNTVTMDFFVYQDWSTNSSTGTGQQGGSTTGTWTTLSATTDMTYWGVRNDYEFSLVMRTGGVFYFLFIGGPKRTHIPEAGRGVAFTTDAPGAPDTDTVASITDAAGTTTLVNDGGFNFVVGDVGRTLRVANATNVQNEGDFVIAGYTSATTVTYVNANGVTEASSPADIEMDVEYSLDRDLTGGVPANGGLVNGQKCWIYPISDSATLDGTAAVIADVVSTATGPDKLTLIGVENAYASGSIVGLDPCPLGLTALNIGTVGAMLFPNSNAAGVGGSNVVNKVIGAMTESNLDPGSEGLYYGSEAYIENTSVTVGGMRGTPETFTFWAIGAQTDGDRMQEDYLTTDAASWKIFPSIKGGSSIYAVAIGKGVSA